MRVCNVGDNRNSSRSASLGQAPGSFGYGYGYTLPREVSFRIIDENGFHVVNPGKKFQYTISNMVLADGTAVPSAAIKGVAVSQEGSIVPIRIQLSQDQQNPTGYAVDATLSLSGVNGNVTYPIFENRRIRFTVPPASPFPLDLQAIYGEISANAAQAAADKYAAEQAALDQQMYQSYQSGVATEAQAAAATEASRVAAEDAAAKKAAADAAAQAAEDARATAANEVSARNKTIMWAVGGLAALGVLGYLAFGK